MSDRIITALSDINWCIGYYGGVGAHSTKDRLEKAAKLLKEELAQPDPLEKLRELLEWLRETHNAEGKRLDGMPFAHPEREAVEAKQEAFIEVHVKATELFPDLLSGGKERENYK